MNAKQRFARSYIAHRTTPRVAPSNVIGNKYHTSQFAWDPSTREFVAEASTLGKGYLARLYNDAADVGFVFVSERTGTEQAVYLNHTEKDSEGDVVAWRYKPVDTAQSFTVVVLND